MKRSGGDGDAICTKFVWVMGKEIKGKLCVLKRGRAEEIISKFEK